MATETFPLNEFTVTRRKESAIRLGHTDIVTLGIRCPRCAWPRPILKHGESGTCPACGLSMTVRGNALKCST